MSGRRILSDEQIDEMAEMREAGSSYETIARHFTKAGTPVHHKTIRWQCLRVGAFPEGKRPANLGKKSPGSKGRAFTAEEDRILLEMQGAGAKTAAIAKELGRAPNSVLGRSMTLASWEAYEELAAA
jgi:hypothetical protein